MYEVSKCAAQEALRDLDKAFNNFFRGLKTGQPIGFPTFKKKGRRDSFRLTGAIKVDGKQIQLPRLGVLTLKERSKIEGRILSATIVREANRWFVCLTVELEKEMHQPNFTEDPVGIDLGLSCFATTSDAEKIVAPKPLAKHLRRLKRLSQQHSRKAKKSRNRKKSAVKLAKLHRRIKKQHMQSYCPKTASYN